MEEVIVVGLGGVGSQALWRLAERGFAPLGIDRFDPPHEWGSTHGETRLIRQAYFEHPDYVPLVRRAYALWHDLESRSGERLFYQTGLIEAGPARGTLIAGVRQSAREQGVAVEELTHEEALERFPGFRWPQEAEIVFEPTAGYLKVEECVSASLHLARQAGARMRTNEVARGWRSCAGGFVVETDQGEYKARRLVIAGGAWAGELLHSMGLKLTVLRKTLHWFRTRLPTYRESAGAPCFLVENADGYFYGFPERDAGGMKIAEHSGGEVVKDPLTVDRVTRAEDSRGVRAFAREYLPGVTEDELRSKVCLYTMSADEHFIVDRHPDFARVAFAAGLSGHGFKFASVLGEILADLVVEGKTRPEAGFLSARRFRS